MCDNMMNDSISSKKLDKSTENGIGKQIPSGGIRALFIHA
jgi:hypothetical protein